jgi:hypothetical protein
VHTPAHDLEFLRRAEGYGLQSTYCGEVSRYWDLFEEDADKAVVHLYVLQYQNTKSHVLVMPD